MRGRKPDVLTIRLSGPSPNWNESLTAMYCRGFKFVVLELFWELLQAGDVKYLLRNSTATNPRSGEPVNAIDSLGLPVCSLISGKATRDVTCRSPRVQRAQIVALACLEPVAKELHITHWSSADLARQAVEDGIVAGISPRTVRRILHDVDLQPHRTRYWKTPRLDARFKERAEQVLWCYGNAARLGGSGHLGGVCR